MAQFGMESEFYSYRRQHIRTRHRQNEYKKHIGMQVVNTKTVTKQEKRQKEIDK